MASRSFRPHPGRAVLVTIAAFAWFARAQTAPVITVVANAEGQKPVIAPNTWVEIKGSNLANPGDSRTWQTSDFVGGQMPATLDGVSVTVNGKSAYLYYISPTQINILTPPDAMPATVSVQVTHANLQSLPFTVSASQSSPSFFVFNGGPYVAATHLSGALAGSASLYPGSTTPAAPGETVVLYANGFGATSSPVVSGSSSQGGALSPLPAVTIGGIAAQVSFAGLISPGLYQINVTVPSNAPSGDNAVVSVVNGSPVQPVPLITIQGQGAAPVAPTYYVSPAGSDFWSGTLATPNAAGTDGPFATFDRARTVVRGISKSGLTQVTVLFRGGTYYLPATEILTATDSGTPTMPIVYQNYPGESPVFSGGVRVQNWTSGGGNKWTATLPAATQYFENLFYNGARRLRPRLGSGAAGNGNLGTYLRVAGTVYLSGSASGPPDPNCSQYISGSGWECYDRFIYSPTDPISPSWKNLAPPGGNPCGATPGNTAQVGDIEVIDFEMYTASKLRINCVDAKNNIVYMTGPTATEAGAHATAHGFIQGHRYLVENVEDALAQPGQWFLDRSTTPWTLTYLANPGENPNSDLVIVPQITPVLATSNLSYVTFQGLAFEHDNYVVPAAGHGDTEMPYDIPAAVSFQASQHIIFDSGVVTQTSGAALEISPCTNALLSPRCVAVSANFSSANNIVRNSAFYDTGENGIRVGIQSLITDTDANVPQFNTIQNNVVEGFGRTSPNAWGISQGEGHDNTYTHNDVYDGYHTAIGVCECTSLKPAFEGTSNNTISFNHVYNLFQGIVNDAGSLYFGVGNAVFTSSGNKVWNNKVHDVSDSSIMDSDGYGGHGIYLDKQTGLVDVENNLVYRVSGDPVNLPKAPYASGLENTIKNNILAFGRLGMIEDSNPYSTTSPPASQIQAFVASNNIFYFDRTDSSTPAFYVQDGCTYAAGFPYTQYQQWTSNLYWRTDGAFASNADAFHVQPNPGTTQLCANTAAKWSFLTFAQWQASGEDLKSVVQNPGFNNPLYPADDYSLPKGSPGVGFVVFDATQAGRSNPVIVPPAIPATFPTKTFNPLTDY